MSVNTGRFPLKQAMLVGTVLLWLFALSIKPGLADSYYYDFCPTDFTVSTDPLSWRANRRNQQTIPITVRFSDRTDDCVTHILFYTDNNTSLVLSSGQDNMETDLVDRHRNHFAQYSINGRIAWAVPVYRVKNLKVWAQLRSTDAQIAGNYTGITSIVATYYGYHISPEVWATVSAEVPSVLDVSVPTNSKVSGSGSYYYVELGNLYNGSSASWNVDIYSNVHYTVSVASENRGLKHQNSSALIPYQVTMDGSTFDAAGGFSRGYTNYNPLSTSSIPFKVKVTDVDFKPAGRYIDNLIVTVSAR
ncbi:hypothetical protein [Planctobacterium marinum]|uniref:hypothetical protein n=1 Tax=Planctobacterium marinum TaxID=1631968 RepID=UPI001E2AB300|nr:hypothetical protein [Planctobacterium marinum]MCC2607273.1 hypothetical protein [Planctobacterium marinum]